ncbi:MAG: CCA tRNA nucleotidyltransferase [Terracidiphilus sp.]
MPDYIYLLENRLSADQQNAVRQLREAAREAGTILFLTGDAVRDLTSGHAVHELEVAVHGNALKLKKTIEMLGGKIWGEDEESRALYLCFPGTVRVDLISAHSVEYSKPGKPVYHPASIQEDLRRRDFTVNAMAISLNEGSFGLLMDPMNGVADIESRTLRLVSNYGFLEEPSFLIRVTRYIARLGWALDPKTHTRYLNALEEGVIERLSVQARREELEQIGHEEEGLKVLRALETEGWMKVLFPAWTSAKADEEGLTALHDLAVQLLVEGVHADMSAAQMRLLTANLDRKDLAALKKLMLRPGFVEEWESLDSIAAGFAKVLLNKENATPSASFKLFTSYDPEAVLWLGFTSNDAAVKERFDLFLKVWPEARQRIPYALMQELRITAELPAYREIVQAIFLDLIDGKLTTPEEARAFLEPFSPPAPPPQVTIKRPRAKRGSEAKIKDDSFDGDEAEENLEDEEEDLDDIGGDDEVLDLGMNLPKVDIDLDLAEESDSDDDADEDDEDEDESKPAPKSASTKPTPKPPAEPKPSKSATNPAVAPAKAQKSAGTPTASKSEKAEKPQPAPKLPQPPSNPKDKANPDSKKPPVGAAKPALTATKRPTVTPISQHSAAKVSPAQAKKPVPVPKAKPAPQKAQAKPPVKSIQKPPAKAPAPKSAPAKKKSLPAPKPAQVAKASKPAAKKPAPKPAKKR